MNGNNPRSSGTGTPRAPIRLLSPEVTDRIAAGEVIERPVSVVKELLENALDAGAREITIEIHGGGLELIRVSDDGHGIPPGEVELAFERHATSKLRSAEDLARVSTLGFRGEALPSIATVADVTLTTLALDFDAAGEAPPGPYPAATSIRLKNGQVAQRGRRARTPGTTVVVRNLFEKVPARFKFLRNARGESAQISQLVRRYAAGRPDLCLRLTLDGHPSFQSSGSGLFDTALAEAFGITGRDYLLPIGPWEQDRASLQGLIGSRELARPNRNYIITFVNGRLVQLPAVLQALESCYRPLFPRGKHPLALLQWTLPADWLDVNVHPTKQEIRLHREEELLSVLTTLVHEALSQVPARPDPTAGFALDGRATQFSFSFPPTPKRVAEAPVSWDAGEGGDSVGPGSEPALTPGDIMLPVAGSLRLLGQVQHSLLLTESESGLYLIDQHRAHERVIYEQLRTLHETQEMAKPLAGSPAAGLVEEDETEAVGNRAGQLLLEPVLLELKPYQAALLAPRLAGLAKLGFACERFGGYSFLVRSAPGIPGLEGLSAHLEELLEIASADDTGWQNQLLITVACRSALRKGQPMSRQSMLDLLSQLSRTSLPTTCPHGSPVILEFSNAFLRKQFGW